MEDLLCFTSLNSWNNNEILNEQNSIDVINVFTGHWVICVFCVVAVLPTIPAALSAEYPACDSSHWAFQLLARSISAKGEKNLFTRFVQSLENVEF